MKQIFIDNITPILYTSGFSLVALLVRYLYSKNLAYHNLISDFKQKRPRQQNRAKEFSKDDKQLNPVLKKVSEHFTVLDTSEYKPTISEKDLDLFFNKLESLDFRWVFFKKHYQKNIKNLNRFKPKAENGNFELATLDIAIDKQITRPRHIFRDYLKHEWKLPSTIYRWFRK